MKLLAPDLLDFPEGILEEQDELTEEDKILMCKAFEFYNKITTQVNSKGYYTPTDPQEEIIPIDGLIIKVGRKFRRIKSDIKLYKNDDIYRNMEEIGPIEFDRLMGRETE
jgi:phage terminase small subunit